MVNVAAVEAMLMVTVLLLAPPLLTITGTLGPVGPGPAALPLGTIKVIP